ncbi:MAG: serine hydrolase [Bacteroidota bacterium]
MFFRFIGLLLFLILLPTSLLFAQADLQQIDRYIQQAQKDWGIPGLSVAIVKDGEIVLEKGYGQIEVGKAQAVDAHSVYAIASNTKAFISTALAMLVEENKIQWDDPVKQYLPDFELYDDYVTQNTSIRDLLCHRVGLGTFSGDVVWYKSEYQAAELVQRLQHVPQAFPFRSGYGYSNLMFITAGEVIKAVSGQSWDQFIQERIFKPLDMNRSHTSIKALTTMDNVASPHKPIAGKHQPIPYVNWDNMGAAGGILSSVHDMAQWLQLQLNHGIWGKDTLFQRSSQEVLWTPHNNFPVRQSTRQLFPDRQFSGYGLGWGLSDYGGQMLVSHGGGYDGMYSRVVLVPNQELGIVVLTNGMKGISSWLTYYIIDAYLQKEPTDWSEKGLGFQNRRDEYQAKQMKELKAKRKLNTQPDLPLSELAGEYESPLFGPVNIQYKDKKLFLHFPKAPSLDAELRHWHLNTFEILWKEIHAWFDFGTLQFVLDNTGEVQDLQFHVPNNDIFFEEIKAKRRD